MTIDEIVTRAIPLTFDYKCSSKNALEKAKAEQRRVELRRNILDLLKKTENETRKQLNQPIQYY